MRSHDPQQVAMRSALKPLRGGEREHPRPVDSLVTWLNPRDSSSISTTGPVREPNSLTTVVTGHGLCYPVEISENSGKLIGRANITRASSVSTGEERGNEENQAGVPWGVSRRFSLLAGVNRHVRLLVSRSIWSGARAEFLRPGERSPSPR